MMLSPFAHHQQTFTQMHVSPKRPCGGITWPLRAKPPSTCSQHRPLRNYRAPAEFRGPNPLFENRPHEAGKTGFDRSRREPISRLKDVRALALGRPVGLRGWWKTCRKFYQPCWTCVFHCYVTINIGVGGFRWHTLKMEMSAGSRGNLSFEPEESACSLRRVRSVVQWVLMKRGFLS